VETGPVEKGSVETAPATPPLVADLLTQATQSVLEMMAQVAVSPAGVTTARPPAAGPMVSSSIALEGDLQGILLASFEEDCLKQLVGNMLGTAVEHLSPEDLQTAGELVNMICGETRRLLSEYGVMVRAGIPALIAGPLPALPAEHRRLVLAFQSAAGAVMLELQVRRHSPMAQSA